ncbi:Protein kinase alk2 [Boothiomyces macroporosus]|uniref:Protein kinase alk2 n=1 Tax=Boothiomyces macroporosus TaxID=261099 RepID=A0AAD5UD83_9FUNG|nr:Protein kinase alk2 [Boothiomyces macroporosus]
MENTRNFYFVGAALGIISAAFWYYKDDAIGATVRVDKSVPRFKIHNPILGGVLQMIKDIDNSGILIEEELNGPDFDRAKVLTIPFAEPTIFVNDPESVEYITNTNFENYIKGTFTKWRLTDVLGNGIFNTDGHDWFVQRKLSAKILTNRNFKLNIETVFSENIGIFIGVLNAVAESQTPVDMHSLFHRYFMDSFGKIAYGIDLNSLSQGIPSYVVSFDRTQNTMGDRLVNPFFPIVDFFNPYLKNDIKMIREFGEKVVKDRVGEPHNDRNDLLSLFLSHCNEDGSKLTTEELADHVISFILAGRDTTAQALSWTLFCLSNNPAAKTALYKEIDEILGDQLIPKYDQIKQMKYANAVFKETLRLYPSVPREGKVAVNDDTLPNGIKIPKGAIVGFCPYAMGRSEKLWENASAYKPERWLNSKQPSNYVYTAFMCGPRICLGKNLAELQGVFTLVSILKNFDFEIIDLGSVKQKMSLTLPMKNGLMCRITKRK